MTVPPNHSSCEAAQWQRRQQNRRATAPQGMTLIELLAAIALVAILVTIALPFYGRVRAGSDAAVCRSNLRQMATAALMFISDNEGRLPFYQYDASIHSTTGPGIREHLGLQHDTDVPPVHVFSVFTCPSLQKGAKPSGLRYNRNYATNGHAFNDDTRDPDTRIGANVGDIGLIPFPGATALYMCGRAGTLTQLQGRYQYPYYVRNKQWSKAHLQFPHNDRQNVVFLDGHIETIGETEAPTDSHKHLFWTGGAFP